MDIGKPHRSPWRRLYAFLESGLEVMARYPYDMTELHWDSDLFGPPDGAGGGDEGGRKPPGPPVGGRSIKVVPPPASQRYQSARPTRIPVGQPNRK